MVESAGRVRGIHFAGGEAFLDSTRLLQLVKIATELRIPIDYIETNGGWCVDPTTTREKMEELKDAGLTCLLVSASPFHAEFIPPKRTLQAIDAAREVFGFNGVIVWLPEFLRDILSIGLDDTIPFDEYVSKVGRNSVVNAVAYGGAMVPGGRAGIRLKEHMRLLPAERLCGGTCQNELLYSGHGHFDLYGNYIPASCTGITIKDARDLPSMIRTFEPGDHKIIDVLCKGGVGELMRFAARNYDFNPASEGYAGKCHLCVEIRRHIVSRTDEYPELGPEGFYRYLSGPHPPKSSNQ